MKKSDNLSTQAYEILKNKILSFALLPGVTLSEQLLSEDLGMSRTPIRQALIELKEDGLIETVNGSKKMFVSSITIENLKELHDFRSAIECKCADVIYANGGLKPKEAKHLQKLCGELINYVEEKDFTNNFITDDTFHMELVKISGNKYLMTSLEKIQVQMTRARFLSIFTPQHYEATIKEHNEIVESYINGTVEETKAVIEKHLQGSVDNYTRILNDNPMNMMFQNAVLMSSMQKNKR